MNTLVLIVSWPAKATSGAPVLPGNLEGTGHRASARELTDVVSVRDHGWCFASMWPVILRTSCTSVRFSSDFSHVALESICKVAQKTEE